MNGREGATQAPRYASLTVGDPAPWFEQRTTTNPRFFLETMAGRYIVLCFLLSSASPLGIAALRSVRRHRSLFDDQRISFFGVSVDPTDGRDERLRENLPGLRYFLDFDGRVSRLYGSMPRSEVTSPDDIRRFWLVLDPDLRVMANIPFRPDHGDHHELFSLLGSLPDPSLHAGMEVGPPVIVLPRVFDADLCGRLIALYEREGGNESGFMREVGGKTVGMHDRAHKSRKDLTIEDPALIDETCRLCERRVYPEIAKVCHFQPTRMERYIVACYAAEDGGHFFAHRDNTTPGTAHRRFAISINLNSDFEGGEISFPEYSRRGIKPPVGGAVVFSGSLLHTVSLVTRGRRYAFLPFVYDEAAQRLRLENSRRGSAPAPEPGAPPPAGVQRSAS